MRLLPRMILGFALLGIPFFACTELSDSVGYAHTSLTYVEDIEPLFTRSCARCHGLDQVRGGLYLTRYDSIVTHSADILRKIENTGNENMYKYLNSPTDAQMIRDWIELDALAFE